MDTSRMRAAKVKHEQEEDKNKNVGTKGKSPKQGLTSAKVLNKMHLVDRATSCHRRNLNIDPNI